jgi:hypothetical protein
MSSPFLDLFKIVFSGACFHGGKSCQKTWLGKPVRKFFSPEVLLKVPRNDLATSISLASAPPACETPWGSGGVGSKEVAARAGGAAVPPLVGGPGGTEAARARAVKRGLLVFQRGRLT